MITAQLTATPSWV